MAKRSTSKKLTVDFNGFDRLKARLDEIGGDATKRAVDGALNASQAMVARQLHGAMKKHHRTGDTEKSIIDGNSDLSGVNWTGDEASVMVGFDMMESGLVSIFLMYGTQVHGQPHIKPDRQLYNAIYGAATKKQIQKIPGE